MEVNSPDSVRTTIIVTSPTVESSSATRIDEVDYEMEAKIENAANDLLDETWRQKALNELGETTEIVEAKLEELHSMLENSKLLPKCRRDNAFLLRFLRAKKFDAEKAFKMMVKYFSMKQQSPEFFKVSPVEELRDLLEMQVQYMTPNRDTNGRKLYIFRVKKCDPYKCAVETVFRTNVLALENAIREPETQIGGIVVLLDMAGAGLGHAKFLAPNLSRKTVEVVQEAFPLRFKAFHIFNEPFYFDAILAVLKPFLKEKIRRRIILHGSNLSSLHNYIPKENLPIEYGGTLSKFDNTVWREKILEDDDYFRRLETFTWEQKDNEKLISDNLIENAKEVQINDSFVNMKKIMNGNTSPYHKNIPLLKETGSNLSETECDDDDESDDDEYELCKEYTELDGSNNTNSNEIPSNHHK